MSFLSRLGKGLAAGLLTDSFSGAAAAALTDNFGIGVGTGVGSRLLDGMNYGSVYPSWGGDYGWGGGAGGYGGMDMNYSNYMYNASYNNFFDNMATTIAWY
ncbi:MAG: hypothetical protein ABIJ09_08900 [Pseudomonadota bacterium]